MEAVKYLERDDSAVGAIIDSNASFFGQILLRDRQILVYGGELVVETL